MNWYEVHDVIFSENNLSFQEKTILWILYRVIGLSPRVYNKPVTSIHNLCNMTGLKYAALYSIMLKLERKGLVAMRKYGSTNAYHICIKKLMGDADDI